MPEVPAPHAPTESERLAALRAYDVLDSGPEPAYDDLTTLAAHICGTPIALVSLVDAERQWFKSRVGLDAAETPRDLAFCAHAILEPDALFVVPDAARDSRFADNPLVTGPPKIRFYAGAPLLNPAGHALGTLCVIDREPRRLSDEQRSALLALGRQVVAQLELRLQLRDRERVIAELHELDAAREAFVATASHELRSPLTSIHGALRLVSGGVTDVIGPEGRELLRIATQNTERVVGLVNDLLDLSKLGAGHAQLEPTAFEARALLETVAAELTPLATERELKLTVEAEVGLVLQADWDALLRVGRNLLSNAIRHSPRQGEVVLGAARTADGQVRLQVTDQGPGLSALEQRQLFLPFSQVGPRRGRDGTTGLGLAIVKSLVEAHGGAVGVDSEPGRGASFWVQLPLG